MADIRDLVNRRDNLEIDLELAQAQLETESLRARNNLPGGAAAVTRLNAEIARIRVQLAEVNAQILQLRGGTATASAGNLVNDDARATVDQASPQHPLTEPQILSNGRIQPVPDTTTSSNAIQPVLLNSVDSGTDDTLRPITETQSVGLGDDEQGGPLLLNAEFDGREDDSGFDNALRIDINGVGGLPGVGAGSDDVGSKNPTRVEIDNVFNEEKIIPQPNVLDQYASYTYSASLYLMNKTDYQAMMQTKTKQLRGAQLLMQSGGAPVGGRMLLTMSTL